MVLKDTCCEVCGDQQEVMCDGIVETLTLYCGQCKTQTRHTTICLGGIKTRWRFADWSGVRDPRVAGIQYEGVRVTYDSDDGPDVHEADGSSHAKRISDPARIQDKRERAQWARDRRDGRGKIVVDRGAKRR